MADTNTFIRSNVPLSFNLPLNKDELKELKKYYKNEHFYFFRAETTSSIISYTLFDYFEAFGSSKPDWEDLIKINEYVKMVEYNFSNEEIEYLAILANLGYLILDIDDSSEEYKRVLGDFEYIKINDIFNVQKVLIEKYGTESMENSISLENGIYFKSCGRYYDCKKNILIVEKEW